MEQIKINSSIKKYQIVDENGDELGVVQVNTTDVNFCDRVKNAEKVVNSAIASVQNIGDMNPEERITTLVKADKQIKEQLDYMFDYKVSDIVFGNRNCLSLSGGEMPIVQFMDGILPYIKQSIIEERRRSEEKIGKYTRGYGV